jgi:hypothetical protein
MKQAAFFVCLALYGCGASTAENAVTAGSYGAQLDACVASSTTRSAADACMCKVSTMYGRACPATVVSDAGTDGGK